MRSLSFDDEEALRVALTAGLVPPTVAVLPADVWVDDGLWLRPRRKLPRAVEDALRAVGVVGDDRSAPPEARRVGCWAEAIAPRRVGEPERIGEVLFVARSSGWLSTAAELLRLGCDRQRYCVGADVALLHVDAPPYFTVARALDELGEVRVFAPVAERVWIELGYEHPLLSGVAPAADELLLVRREGVWEHVPTGEWASIEPLVDLTLPGGGATFEPGPPPQRIEIPLRLVPTGWSRPPSLWRLTGDAWGAMERLLRDLPEPAQRGLAFAVGEVDGASEVWVRARAGYTIAELSLEAERYASHPLLASLWIPCDATLEPPLGVDQLRERTGAGAQQAVVIRASERGPRALSILEDAFTPLDGWVDYVLAQHATAIQPWIQSATFDFDVLEVALPEAAERPRRERTRWEPDEPDDDEAAVERERDDDHEEVSAPAPTPARSAVAPLATVSRSEAEERVRALEVAFFEHDREADSDERQREWAQLAEAYVAVERLDQAAHAWVRMVWEHPDDAVWRRWADAAGPLPEPGAAAGRRDVHRLLCGLALGEPLELEAVAITLDRLGRDLDVRSQWLAQQLVARRTHDVLRLTRARDALLGELRRGLSLERDVPAFVRARATGLGDLDHVEAVAAALDGLRDDLEHGKRTRSASEAPLDHSLAYALRMLAWAHARLGRLDAADTLLTDARARLSDEDVIHRVLTRTLEARVEQAREGLPPTAALPGALQAELNELTTFQRYTVDRLRGVSRILEPVEHLDAVDAFRRAETDPRGELFASLRGVEDPRVIDPALAAILGGASSVPPEERARLFGGAMDFFYLLPVTRAVGLLEGVVAELDAIPPMARALLLEEALVLAAHLGAEGLVERLADRLEALASDLAGEQTSTLAAVLRGALRSLRRMGLRDRAASLLDAVARHMDGDGPASRDARMHLAGGLAFLGEIAQAEALVEAELEQLHEEMTIKQRVDRIRAIADAVGSFDGARRLRWATALGEQRASITDSFSSNSHFCLSLLHFTESMVHALVPLDDRRGGPAGAWLDEDEHRVRRRIHADLRGMA